MSDKPPHTPLTSVEGFMKLVNWAWKDKLKAFVVLCIIGLGYFAYTQATKIDIKLDTLHYFTRPSSQVEMDRANKIQATDEILNRRHDQVLIRNDADRVITYLFHNNQHGVGGDPWAYVSARYISVNDGIQFDVKAAQGLPFSVWNEIIQKTTPNTGGTFCVKVKTEEIKSSWLRSWAQPLGTTLSYACGIRSTTGTQLGFTLNTYVRRTPILSDEQILTNLSKLAEEAGVRIQDTVDTNIPKITQ